MIRLHVNGSTVQLDADPATLVLWALRDHLNLTGTKFGCSTYQRMRAAIKDAAAVLGAAA